MVPWRETFVELRITPNECIEGGFCTRDRLMFDGGGCLSMVMWHFSSIDLEIFVALIRRYGCMSVILAWLGWKELRLVYFCVA